jgi:hypothetical protein
MCSNDSLYVLILEVKRLVFSHMTCCKVNRLIGSSVFNEDLSSTVVKACKDSNCWVIQNDEF